jgi:hypothetical protein
MEIEKIPSTGKHKKLHLKNKKPSIKSKTKIYIKNALDSPDLTPENKAVANKFQKHHNN